MDSSTTWLYAAGALIEALCLILIFLYVATRRSDGTRARLYAMIGFGLILVQVLGMTLVQAVLSYSVSPAEFGQSALLLGVVGNLLSVTSKVFLAAAVFTGRQTGKSEDPMAQQFSSSRAEDHSNPYQPPGQ